MNALLLTITVVLAVAGLIWWADRHQARVHARYQSHDVERALAEMVSPDSKYIDEFDLFLSRPIDDPYLESVRQRCLAALEDYPAGRWEYVSDEALARVRELLNELRNRQNRSGDPA
jgi:hypothetical protein